jgi:hypothetical protein
MSIVRIKTPDQVSSGMGTKVTNQDGAEIHGVKRVVVYIDAKEVTTTTVELSAYCAIEATTEGVFVMLDPLSGLKKQIKRIEFADGSGFEA